MTYTAQHNRQLMESLTEAAREYNDVIGDDENHWNERFYDFSVDCTESGLFTLSAFCDTNIEATLADILQAATCLYSWANDNLNPETKLTIDDMRVSAEDDGLYLEFRGEQAKPQIDEDKLSEKLGKIRDTVVQAIAAQDLEARIAAMESVADIMFEGCEDVRSAV